MTTSVIHPLASAIEMRRRRGVSVAAERPPVANLQPSVDCYELR
jgi:hypothetical protein